MFTFGETVVPKRYHPNISISSFVKLKSKTRTSQTTPTFSAPPFPPSLSPPKTREEYNGLSTELISEVH